MHIINFSFLNFSLYIYVETHSVVGNYNEEKTFFMERPSFSSSTWEGTRFHDVFSSHLVYWDIEINLL